MKEIIIDNEKYYILTVNEYNELNNEKYKNIDYDNFEILAIKNDKKNIIYNKYKDNNFNADYFDLKNWIVFSTDINNVYSIYKIKYKDIIYCIGDIVKNVLTGKTYKITKIFFDNTIELDNIYLLHFSYIEKININDYIYKTFDNIEIYDPETELYGVCIKSQWETKTIKLKNLLNSLKYNCSSYKKDTWLFFAKEENRNKYIEENRPNYSLNNIKQAAIDIYGENKLNLNNFLDKIKIYKNLK